MPAASRAALIDATPPETEAVVIARERQWIEACQAGDQGAFRPLVESYQRRIYSTAYRLLGHPADAEEAAQEVFLRLYRSVAHFDPTRRLSTWLYRIAVNVCIDKLRKRRQEPHVDVEPEEPSEGAELRLIRQQSQRAVQDALVGLAEDYRVALVLKDIEGLEYRQMAEILDVSVPALKIRVVRARRQLAKKLKKLHPELIESVSNE